MVSIQRWSKASAAIQEYIDEQHEHQEQALNLASLARPRSEKDAA